MALFQEFRLNHVVDKCSLSTYGPDSVLDSGHATMADTNLSSKSLQSAIKLFRYEELHVQRKQKV